MNGPLAFPGANDWDSGKLPPGVQEEPQEAEARVYLCIPTELVLLGGFTAPSHGAGPDPRQGTRPHHLKTRSRATRQSHTQEKPLCT